MWRSLPMRCLWARAAPNGPAHRLWGQGVPPKRLVLPMERLWGMVAPDATGPQAVETGSRAQATVAAYWMLT